MPIVKSDYKFEKDFWARVIKRDGCWAYCGGKTKAGYGLLSHNGKRIYAHRYSMQLHGHDIEGKQVLHTCDKPNCVNPEHLYLGDDQDNADDRDRQIKHKLSKEIVKEIKQDLKNGEKGRSIALREGVTETLISMIKHGKVWEHVGI